VIEIPKDKVSAATLEQMVEDFVLREGTDYGFKEHSLEQKKTSYLQTVRGQSYLY